MRASRSCGDCAEEEEKSVRTRVKDIGGRRNGGRETHARLGNASHGLDGTAAEGARRTRNNDGEEDERSRTGRRRIGAGVDRARHADRSSRNGGPAASCAHPTTAASGKRLVTGQGAHRMATGSKDGRGTNGRARQRDTDRARDDGRNGKGRIARQPGNGGRRDDRGALGACIAREEAVHGRAEPGA
ncbi:unnamed protein product [Closterium sp. Naga37s-1]|nr:unnamed protein product [Closterium sp. Naga37s-1]